MFKGKNIILPPIAKSYEKDFRLHSECDNYGGKFNTGNNNESARKFT